MQLFTKLASIMLRLFSLVVLGVLSAGQPIDRVIDDNSLDQTMSDTPKWYNHCKSSHHLSHQMSQTKSVTMIKELLQRVKTSAHISLKRAEDVKRKFVEFEHIFDDFEGLKLRPEFKWLPEVPPVYDDMTKEVALLKVHEYIEKFAVAFEQIMSDQNSRDLNDVYSNAIEKLHFKDIDDDNYSVLCEIRIAMSVVFDSVNQHFLTQTKRQTMPEEDRTITVLSKRMLRDYLILRQYVKTMQFVAKLFEHLNGKL